MRIGYEYRGCGRASEIAWVKRRVFMEGARARRLEGGAWSVDIHHHLDAVNGQFLVATPPTGRKIR